MSVYKPKNSPFWQFDFERNGRRFYGSTKATTEGKAKAFERREIAKVESGVREGNQVMLDLAAATYWDQVAKWQRSSSATEYRLANLIRHLGEKTLLSEINDTDVAAMVSKRRGERSRRALKAHGKACICPACVISPASVNRETELLKRIMRRAQRVEKAKVGDIDWRLHKLDEPEPPDRPLTDAQEDRLYAEMTPHLVPIVTLALLTGLRLNNVVGLDWKQVDMKARTITVRLKSRKPKGRVHIVEMDENAIVLLANLGPQDPGRVFRYGPPCGCVTCRQKRFKGKPINSPRTAWEGARERAGIPEFRFHDLRHTVGTRILAMGYDLKAAQKYLGHASITSTVRYAHHAPGIKREIMGAISGKSRKIHEATTEDVEKSQQIRQNTKRDSSA